MDEHIQNIWGSAISNTDLDNKFDQILEHFAAGDEQDICEQIKELECNFYMHEFIRRLVWNHANFENIEGFDYLSLIKLINTLLNMMIISKSQLEVGVKQAKHEISKLGESGLQKLENFKTLQDQCLSKIKFRYE